MPSLKWMPWGGRHRRLHLAATPREAGGCGSEAPDAPRESPEEPPPRRRRRCTAGSHWRCDRQGGPDMRARPRGPRPAPPQACLLRLPRGPRRSALPLFRGICIERADRQRLLGRSGKERVLCSSRARGPRGPSPCAGPAGPAAASGGAGAPRRRPANHPRNSSSPPSIFPSSPSPSLPAR